MERACWSAIGAASVVRTKSASGAATNRATDIHFDSRARKARLDCRRFPATGVPPCVCCRHYPATGPARRRKRDPSGREPVPLPPTKPHPSPPHRREGAPGQEPARAVAVFRQRSTSVGQQSARLRSSGPDQPHWHCHEQGYRSPLRLKSTKGTPGLPPFSGDGSPGRSCCRHYPATGTSPCAPEEAYPTANQHLSSHQATPASRERPRRVHRSMKHYRRHLPVRTPGRRPGEGRRRFPATEAQNGGGSSPQRPSGRGS